MSEKTILKVLGDFRLTKRESQVYMFLAEGDAQKAMDISRSLKMHKAQVYRILKKLERRDMVESTFESPMRFTAVPFEKFLDLFIMAKRLEASSLENEKGDLVTDWRSIDVASVESNVSETLNKFGANSTELQKLQYHVAS